MISGRLSAKTRRPLQNVNAAASLVIRPSLMNSRRETRFELISYLLFCLNKLMLQINTQEPRSDPLFFYDATTNRLEWSRIFFRCSSADNSDSNKAFFLTGPPSAVPGHTLAVHSQFNTSFSADLHISHNKSSESFRYTIK